jgi:hypothetical protein
LSQEAERLRVAADEQRQISIELKDDGMTSGIRTDNGASHRTPL